MMGGKTEEERISGAERPGAGKVVYTQTESGITGDWEGGGGKRRKRRRKRRTMEEKLMGGRK